MSYFAKKRVRGNSDEKRVRGAGGCRHGGVARFSSGKAFRDRINSSWRKNQSGGRLGSGPAPTARKSYPFPALGGRRRARLDSPNAAWRNPSFRGYADHMDSAEFAEGFQALVELSRRLRTALMCAEAVWWRCHRALIADRLMVDGIEVVHILDAKHAVRHPYTAPARIVDGKLRYVGPADDAAEDGRNGTHRSARDA